MTPIQYRRLFRASVIGQFLLTVLSGTAGALERNTWPEQLRLYALSRAEPSNFELIAGLFFIFLTIVTAVGLYKFWGPARPLYLVSIVLAYLFAGFLPPEVYGGLQSTFAFAGATLSGVMIGLMYFSPIAAEFVAGRSANEMRGADPGTV
jgi:hypothetical protein